MSNGSTEMRKFPGGATRNTEQGKLDFEGFLSPLVLRRYAQYLDLHREQADGVMRDSDNWQKGIPREVYVKSAFRHFVDMWAGHRKVLDVDIEESCCALMFNVMGYLFETLKDKAGDYNEYGFYTDELTLLEKKEIDPNPSRSVNLTGD